MSGPWWRRPVLALVASLAVMVVAASVVSAAEVRRGRTVEVPAGAVVSGDLVVEGGSIKLYGRIAGDLTARAGFVNQVGDVGGDVTVQAGRAELRGAIGGSVRAIGGSVSLYGSVAGGVEMWGGQLTIVEGATVAGDLTVHGGQVTIVATARVDGVLRGHVGRATIEGEVGRVDLTVGRLALAPGARIEGPLRYESRAAATIPPGATVDGQVARRDPAARLPAGRLLLWHAAALPRLALLLVLGMALVLLLPRRLIAAAETVRRAPGATLLSGLGLLLFTPLVLLLLAVLVITLPLAVILGATAVVVICAGAPVAGLALGRAMLRRAGDDRQRRMNLLAVSLGVTVLALLQLLPLPLLEPLLVGVTIVLGLGGLSRGRWREPPDERVLHLNPGGRPLLSLLAGVLSGSIAVGLGLVAVTTATIAVAGVAAAASQSASFAWEIAPAWLALIAWTVAAVALTLTAVLVALAWVRHEHRGQNR